MNIDALKRPLGIDEIDFRVQSVNKGGYAVILAYKDARADMTRLDEAVGPLGWKREHTNGNANCTVSLYDKETQQWISKEDTGSESNTEAAKGLASDSFKRACFNWGIGRELYDYPLISVKLFDSEVDMSGQRPKATWNLKLKEWTWFSQFKDGKIVYLGAKDQNGKKRFEWGTFDPNLKKDEVIGKASNSEPEQDSPTVVKDESNPEGLLKKKAEPIEEKPEEETKMPSEEEIKWNELAQKYELIFGKKPRANTKLETLEAKIAEETEKRKAEQEAKEDTGGGVYSAPGEEAEEAEESEEEEVEEVEAEEVEAEEVDLGMHGGPISEYANKIDTFTDREELKTWAIDSIQKIRKMNGVPKQHETDFMAAVNTKYEKLG
jgi:hypothetical protein